METITGYLMVRKPSYNYAEGYMSGYHLPPINQIYYYGIDRLYWFDIEVYFHKNLLNKFLDQKYREIENSVNDGTFIGILKKITEANLFINLNEDIKLKNEIIAISSPTLNSIKGECQIPSSQIEWLGYDILQLGGWSLIRHALFENRQYSMLEKNPLNSYGLFDNIKSIDKFLEAYDKLALLDKVDPIVEGSIVDPVRIARLKDKS
ncbi:hypothetical protein [Xanthocytophaga agilis]|uniref:Uncharacterized protein n=1 Tax=Xanthocytophaga agilis TaxID=3048010 RepID=A0AAE3UJI2_9BACT|nr:hypothetical protein [Xanthocytophaga agilis]MDJ1505188.1 hypothetical protein [Xanthocytophaga agilis]